MHELTIFKYLSNLMFDTERACSVSSCLSKSLPNHILFDQENHLKQIKLLPKSIAFVKQDSSCQYNTNTVGHAPLIHLWKLGEDCYCANNAKFIPFSPPPLTLCPLSPAGFHPTLTQLPSPVPLELEMPLSL